MKNRSTKGGFFIDYINPPWPMQLWTDCQVSAHRFEVKGGSLRKKSIEKK
jgi:hypothetical protein